MCPKSGNVTLVDVLRDHLRFRVRVHGTEMSEPAQYDLTGSFATHRRSRSTGSYVIGRRERLTQTGQPNAVHHDRDREIDGRHHCYEVVWLLLLDDGVAVTQLIYAPVYQHRP